LDNDKTAVTGPGGVQFEVLGRAAGVDIQPAPYVSATGASKLISVKHGGLFACSSSTGDIVRSPSSGEGLFAYDTRFLCGLTLSIDGKRPLLLSSSAEHGHLANFELTNPRLDQPGNDAIEQMTLNLRRTRLIQDRLYERLEISNHGRVRAHTTLTASLEVDFADIFEIRGVRRRSGHGRILNTKATEKGLRFAYLGEDDLFRETIVEFSPHPAHLNVAESGNASADWDVDIDAGRSARFEMIVEPSLQGHRAAPASFEEATSAADSGYASWRSSCASIVSSQRTFNRVVDASIKDIYALTTPANNGRVVAAGIPWYVAPFGRDSLLTNQEMLLVGQGEARRTLLYLAAHQATEDDPDRDAEPGKVLHELRAGELARAGHIAHTPYYGTVDATPLFLILAASYYQWTGDLRTLADLRPNLDAALRWIDEFGDIDGDGFVEYRRRAVGGLDNQGWKDSEDSIVHRDASLAEGPIAVVEVQGYVYMAKRAIADVYTALGATDIAADLVDQSETLKRSFDDAFWMPDEGTYALALDGSKRCVASVASNPGHCLYAGVVPKEKAGMVVERLMAADMFSGWGIRTLSSKSAAFNPMSYHNGSVWPHDNAVAAAGFKRYGFHGATERVANALLDAAVDTRELRLPELYCGFDRRPGAPFVRYPVACSPQAWAAAAPIMVLQAMLGVSASASDHLLTVDEPHLPEWLPEVRLRNLCVGPARVDLQFVRQGSSTSVSVLEKSEDLKINLLA
jgi:glycogen debranching enzyme